MELVGQRQQAVSEVIRTRRRSDEDRSRVVEQLEAGVLPRGAGRFARSEPVALRLTVDELWVLRPSGAVVMRQPRRDLAMVRHRSRGGERVALATLGGEELVLRFSRANAAAAGVLADWLAGLPAGDR